MRNVSTSVLSLAAMVLSSMTTYLTFFDARYTLTAAISSISGSTQRSAGSNGETYSVSFFHYATPAIILSNRGTRSLVVTEVNLVRSSSKDTCEATEERLKPFSFESFIVEPDTVQQMKLEYPLPKAEGERSADEAFNLASRDDLWCLEWIVFDQNGGRREPLMPAMTFKADYVPDEDGEYLDAEIDMDAPKAPFTLLTRGLL
ncbi:MAG: hypothetical protein AAF719_13435 [Pseudomonadota bacterium]